MTGPVLKRAALELGGNAPLIILDDAHLESAVNAAVVGKFLHQGQICVATNRIIVHHAIRDRFIEAYVERVRHLNIGDPNLPDTVIGPLISKRQADAMETLIARGMRHGARLLLGGERIGLMVPPHIFTDVTADNPLAQEESFGPLAPVITVKNDEEAIQVANSTEFGLSSALFTQDLERASRIAHRIDAGMTHINDVTSNDYPNTPFGGEKNSGLGRFGGQWIIEELTRTHWVSVQHGQRSYPF